MRTDGIDMAPEAVSATRNTIKEIYGNKYLPEKPRFYKNKFANAQDAHECIRPTAISKMPPTIKIIIFNKLLFFGSSSTSSAIFFSLLSY